MQAEDYPAEHPSPFSSNDDAVTPDSFNPTLRPVLTIWTWLTIAVISILTFSVALALTLLVGLFDRRRAVVGTVVRWGATLAVKVNPLWKFSLVGELPEYRPKKTVCVSNHCSHTDVFLISHLPWNVLWLAKASLFKIPFLGWSMWLAGDIAVVRGKAHSAKSAMQRCADWLERGVPIMIFPEGTRATTKELLPFKDGAFRLAIDTGADILPMAVAGTSTALRKHDWRAHYSRGVLTVGNPISTRGMTVEDVPVLKERVRTEIVALREKIRPLASE